MRTLLFAALVLCASVKGEVIKCPERYPSKDVLLPEIPSGHQSSARLIPARLSLAYMYFGDLYGEQYLEGPGSRKVKDGWDTEYNFTPQETKWLVCVYGGTEWSGLDRISGGSIERWEKLDPKIISCVLKVRETKIGASLSDWTATASCK